MSHLDQSDPSLPIPRQAESPEEKPTGSAAPWLWVTIAVLGLTVIGLAGYRVWPILFPTIAQLAVPDAGCDLHSDGCVARFPDGGRVRFAIAPNGIPVSKPLDLSVDLQGVDASAVQVDFVGVDMDMGFNRMPLADLGSGRFGGQGMLPVCVRARMLWEARVLIETPDGLWAAPFRFETIR